MVLLLLRTKTPPDKRMSNCLSDQRVFFYLEKWRIEFESDVRERNPGPFISNHLSQAIIKAPVIFSSFLTLSQNGWYGYNSQWLGRKYLLFRRVYKKRECRGKIARFFTGESLPQFLAPSTFLTNGREINQGWKKNTTKKPHFEM